jgi:hypothetical protein
MERSGYDFFYYILIYNKKSPTIPTKITNYFKKHKVYNIELNY